MGKPRSEIAERLDIRGADECWEWKGSTSSNGYGVVKWGGRRLSVHRIAYEQAHGAIPAGQYVCHRCDNRLCCNPAHLFAGTPAANSADRNQKGRQAHGEGHWKAKLTADDARKIRRLYAGGSVSQQELARAFGVSRPTVSHVVRGAHWRDEIDAEPVVKHRIGPEAAAAIRERYAAGGISQAALGREYGISQSEVSVIVLRKAWS